MIRFCITKDKPCLHLKHKDDVYFCVHYRKKLMMYKKRSRIMGEYILIKPCKACIDDNCRECDMS